jgi:hypothetical protein
MGPHRLWNIALTVEYKGVLSFPYQDVRSVSSSRGEPLQKGRTEFLRTTGAADPGHPQLERQTCRLGLRRRTAPRPRVPPGTGPASEHGLISLRLPRAAPMPDLTTQAISERLSNVILGERSQRLFR